MQNLTAEDQTRITWALETLSPDNSNHRTIEIINQALAVLVEIEMANPNLGNHWEDTKGAIAKSTYLAAILKITQICISILIK